MTPCTGSPTASTEREWAFARTPQQSVSAARAAQAVLGRGDAVTRASVSAGEPSKEKEAESSEKDREERRERREERREENREKKSSKREVK